MFIDFVNLFCLFVSIVFDIMLRKIGVIVLVNISVIGVDYNKEER